jgi:hypothetical protein
MRISGKVLPKSAFQLGDLGPQLGDRGLQFLDVQGLRGDQRGKLVVR